MVLICLVVVVVQALLLCSFISYVQKSWLSIIVPSSLLGTEIYFWVSPVCLSYERGWTMRILYPTPDRLPSCFELSCYVGWVSLIFGYQGACSIMSPDMMESEGLWWSPCRPRLLLLRTMQNELLLNFISVPVDDRFADIELTRHAVRPNLGKVVGRLRNITRYVAVRDTLTDTGVPRILSSSFDHTESIIFLCT